MAHAKDNSRVFGKAVIHGKYTAGNSIKISGDKNLPQELSPSARSKVKYAISRLHGRISIMRNRKNSGDENNATSRDKKKKQK